MWKYRIIWFVLWILSIVGISFFGGNISYGFFYCITLIPIISLLYLFCVYLFFRIYQKIDTRNIVAGHSVPYFFTLQNGVFFTFSGIKIKFYSSFSNILDLDDNVEYELMPGTKIDRQTLLFCKYKGEYEVGIKEIYVTDFFRFFTFKYTPHDTLRAIVKPNIISLDVLSGIDTLMYVPRNRDIDHSDPDNEVRDYADGDPLRYIHWGLSAREQKLKVRKFVTEEKQGISLLMETSRCDKQIEKYLPIENKIVETTLAVSLYLVNKSIPINVHYLKNEHIIKGLYTQADFDDFYENIASTPFDENFTFDKLASGSLADGKIYESKMVILVVSDITKETERFMDMLRTENVNVLVYRICDENSADITVDSRFKIVNVSVDDDLKEVLA